MDFAHRSAFARSRAFKTYKVMHQKTIEKPQGGISDIIAHKEEVEHISEAGVGKLMNFIKAKGLDPTTMDNNQKKNYSGSSEYRVFKVLHPEDPKKKLLQDKKKLKETSGMGERGEDWSDATDEPFVKVKAEKKKLKEEADAVDTVTMDIPLLIRVLEFAREDAKTDMDLHKVVENLINMRGDGTLSMQNYAKIVAIKEHIESLDEALTMKHQSSHTTQKYADTSNSSAKRSFSSAERPNVPKTSDGHPTVKSRFAGKAGQTRVEPSITPTKVQRLDKDRPIPSFLKKEHIESLDEISKKTAQSYLVKAGKELDKGSKTPQKRDKRIDGYWNASKRLSNEKPTSEEVEELSELSTELLGRYKKAAGAQASAADKAGNYAKGNKRFSGIVKATKKQFDNDAKKINELKKQPDNMDADDHITREAMENPCWTGYKMVGSKVKNGKTVPNCVPSGRKNIIKSAAKKKLGESTYDWEKDDKGDNKKPNAKIIMKGGTTLTGKPRDTVEIEPVLKTRPNSAGGKPSV
jgi:hypothetical protein